MADGVMEHLAPKPLADWVRDMGLAVAEANQALSDVDTDIEYTIPEANVKLKVAFSIDKKSELEAGGSFGIAAFSVNASYKSTYGFTETGSSEILVKIQAKPRERVTAAPAAKKAAVKKSAAKKAAKKAVKKTITN